jgi:hypothetical protein
MATAYPVTCPGLRVLCRWRVTTPAAASRSKNSSGLAAAAAAVMTWRRRVIRGFGASGPGGFLGFGAGRAAGRGPVGGGRGGEVVVFLGGLAGVADPVPVVVNTGPVPVLAGGHGDNVDVVGGVPDGDPPDGVVVLPVPGQPGPVHHGGGDARPFAVGQQRVTGRGPQRAVPYRALISAGAEGGMGLVEQAVQRAEVTAAVGLEGWFEFGGVPPSGDDVRAGVLVAAARPVQVPDQRLGPLPARAGDLPDHRSAFRTWSAAWSRRAARRAASAA